MNAPEIAESGSRLILPLESSHRRSKSSCLEEKTDVASVSSMKHAINIVVYDDSNLEGDTLVEDAVNISSSDTNSHCSFDAKDWQERLATTEIFLSGSTARSHSCGGRVRAQNAAQEPLQFTPKQSKPLFWEKSPPSPYDDSENIKTPTQANNRGSILPSWLESGKHAATTRSISGDGRESRGDESSSCSTHYSPNFQRYSHLRSVKVEEGRDLGQGCNVSEEIVQSRVLNSAQGWCFEKTPISVLGVFNKLLRGCDAIERYNADPDACFAINKGNGNRCKNPRCDKETRRISEQKIQCFLDDMAKLHVTRNELLSAQLLLRKFVDLTTCSRSHRKEYYTEIALIEGSQFPSVSTKIDSDETKTEETKLESKPDGSSPRDTIPTASISVNDGQDERNLQKDSPAQRTTVDDGDHSTGFVISTLEKFNGLFPHAEEWFRGFASKCLWQKLNGDRCGNRIVAKNKKVIQELFAVLGPLSIETHALESSNQMGKLADLAFCVRYHRQKARAKIQESLTPTLIDKHGKAILSGVVHEGGKDVQGESADRLFTPPGKQKVASDDTKEIVFKDSRKRHSTTKQRAPEKETGEEPYEYVPNLKPYVTSESMKFNLVAWVRRQVLKKLQEKSEIAEGYIYVYWNRAVFGARKIGYSSASVDGRLESWKKQCKHAAEEVYRSPIKVPHIQRLEKIIHAELRDYRVYEPECRGCGKLHKEWFKDLPDSVLHETIRKWTDWMMKRPYEKLEQGWQLSEIAMKALPELSNKIRVANRKNKSKHFEARAARTPRTFHPGAAKDRGKARRKSKLPLSPAGKDRHDPPSHHQHDLRSKNQ